MSCSILALCFSSFLLFASTTAFNITQILSNQPKFSNFNDLLTRTQLADQINSRQTITVLVLENSQLSSLSSQPLDFVKKILSIHVILDYYDVAKLQQLPNKTTTVTTLYQTTGPAAAREGFLNVTDQDGKVLIGSASKGSNLNSNLVGSVYAMPYNVSVLQVSAAIVPGAGGSSSTPSPPASAPGDAPSSANAPSDDIAPAPSNSSNAPSVSPAPAKSLPPASPPPAPVGPSPADSPAAVTPASAAAVGGTGIWNAVVGVVVSCVWIGIKVMS